MDLNEFNGLVLSRQSCREYSDKKVEKETIEKILKVALNSPSACNSQPWHVYAILDIEKVEKVRECVQEGGVNAFTSNVPAFIVVAEERTAELKTAITEKFGANHFVKYDIGELVAYITLSAKAEGLDTCILGNVNVEKLFHVIEMRENEISYLVIAIGYGLQPLRKKVRKDFNEKVKFI